eukprot:4127023-Amphidinium_carterae.1
MRAACAGGVARLALVHSPCICSASGTLETSRLSLLQPLCSCHVEILANMFMISKFTPVFFSVMLFLYDSFSHQEPIELPLTHIFFHGKGGNNTRKFLFCCAVPLSHSLHASKFKNGTMGTYMLLESESPLPAKKNGKMDEHRRDVLVTLSMDQPMLRQAAGVASHWLAAPLLACCLGMSDVELWLDLLHIERTGVPAATLATTVCCVSGTMFKDVRSCIVQKCLLCIDVIHIRA